MLRHALVIFTLLCGALAVNAATLTVTPDKGIYQVGETITLSIVGDSQGGSGSVIQGYILFDPSLARGDSISQQPLTSFGGLVTWVRGVTRCNDVPSLPRGCLVFNQIGAPANNPFLVDNLLLATLQLTALNPGVVDFSWETRTTTGFQIIFLGLTNAPGSSITIVPEPGTGALLSFGLLAVALSRRRSRAAR